MTSAGVATFSSQLVVAVLSLVHIVIVARALGAIGRGEIVFLTTLAGLTGYVSTVSAQAGLGNQAGTVPLQRRSLATNALAMAAVLGVAGGSVLFFAVKAAGFLNIEIDTVALFFAALAIPGFVLLAFFSALVQADYGFKLSNISLISVAAWIFVVDSVLALTGLLSVRLAVGVWAAGQFVGCIPLAYYLARGCGFGRPDAGLARAALVFGTKAHGAGLLNTGTYRLDGWILGAMAGAGPLGIYSVAVAWFEGLFLLPTAFAIVSRPAVVEASSDEAGGAAETALRVSLVGTTGAGIVLFLAAPILCVWVFGDEFASAVAQLRYLIPGALGIALLKVLGSALTARGKPALETAGVATGFLIGMALYVVLIPRFGGVGASIASTIAYLTAGVVTATIFTRTVGNGWRALIPRRSDLRWAAGLAKGRG